MSNVKSELQERIKRLQTLLIKNNISAALIQKPRNLYYYTNTSQPSNLWVPVEGEPILFTRRVHELIREQTSITHVKEATSLKEMINYLAELNILPKANEKIGVELDIIPFNIIKKIEEVFYQNKLVSLTNIIAEQRFVKSEREIQYIRESAKLWKKSHEAILNNVKAGMKEYEVSSLFEAEARKNGGDGFVWFHRWDAILPGGGIVASGENTWVISGHAMTVTGVGLSNGLPWGASNRTLKNNDLMVVDYGVTKNSYHSDMARTYAIGKATIEQKDLWKKLVNLHLEVINQITPGKTGKELYDTAISIAKKMKLLENFMGFGKNRGEYIGHSIGLEIDELPVIGPAAIKPLPENAIITIEPKFMVPGIGSVMVEDDILITKDGYEIIEDIGYELYEL